MSLHVAATTPYPWPFDGDLTGAATALLVLAPAGGPPPDAAVLASIRRLAQAVRGAGGTVLLATTTAPVRAGRASGVGAPSTVPDLLAGMPPDRVVVAGGLDAFYASDLDLVLRRRGITRLLLAGGGLETAVHSTMRDANDRGYECLLVRDACAPHDPTLVPASVSMVEMSGGIFGAVGRAADVVAALTPADVPTYEGALR